MDSVYWCRVQSPLGPVLLAATGAGLKRIAFEEGEPAPERPEEWLALAGASAEGAAAPAADAAGSAATLPVGGILRQAARQVAEYFAGTRREFDLPLAADGNPFQQRVWALLRGIPYGQTRSYGELARHLGRPGAARAVGSANARNPLPIVVPCHRVIGADGTLTGYAGGLRLKAFLLELERRCGDSAQPSLL
jgi:methylated-DNA-[protein]-cysteine S-methyltransferase